jgi:DNA polymerase elongation subunit (family B)
MKLSLFIYDAHLYNTESGTGLNIWAFSLNNKPVLLRVPEIQFYAYLQINKDLDLNTKNTIVNYIYSNLSDLQSYNYNSKYKLYPYSPVCDFILLGFKNLKSLNSLELLIKNAPKIQIDSTIVELNVYETEVDPVKKFFAYNNINYCEWIQCECTAVESENYKISTLQNEYIGNIFESAEIESDPPDPKFSIFRVDFSNSKYILSFYTHNNNKSEICDSFSDLYPCDSILQLYNKLEYLIVQDDPDLIIGYELFSKTYPDLHKELKKYKIQYTNLGRLKNTVSTLSSKKWKSSAYGYNEVHILHMDGRISLDLYPFIKRNNKLDKYDLEYVASKLLIPLNKHSENLQDIQTLSFHNDNRYKCSNPTARILDLLSQSEMWLELIEFSKIFKTSLVDLYTRGEQVRVFNLLYTYIYRYNYVLNKPPNIEIGLEGGYINSSEPNLYSDTLWFDLKSLYPSICVAYNICYSTYVESDKSDIELNQVIGTNNGGVFGYNYVNSKVRMGLLPKLLSEAISERDYVKNKISLLPVDSITYKKLSKRELALKISSNAAIGFLGISGEAGILPFIKAAISINYLGRSITQGINDYIVSNYNGTILYNDTDSIVCTVPNLARSELQGFGTQMAIQISETLENPLKLKFERTGKFLLLKNKKYAVLEYDAKGNETDYIVKKGLLVGRSDSPEFAEKLYSEMLDYVLKERSVRDTFLLILQYCTDLINNQIQLSELTMVKKINTTYAANSTYFLKRFLDRLQARDIKIRLGTEIEYVVLDIQGQTKIGDKMELKDFVKIGDRIDYMYYIDNVCNTNITDLWNTCFSEKLQKYSNISYKPKKSRKRAATINEPIKIITLTLEAGLTLDSLIEWVDLNLI